MERRLPASAASVRAARNLVTLELFEAGWPPDTIERARLLTSELATNSVVHAGVLEYDLVVDVTDDRMRCTVVDAGAGAPTLRQVTRDSTDGHGLGLVEQLADRWGVETGSGTKSVWFEVGSPWTSDRRGHVSLRRIPSNVT